VGILGVTFYGQPCPFDVWWVITSDNPARWREAYLLLGALVTTPVAVVFMVKSTIEPRLRWATTAAVGVLMAVSVVPTPLITLPAFAWAFLLSVWYALAKGP
jgi:uncharacterized membrane protein